MLMYLSLVMFDHYYFIYLYEDDFIELYIFIIIFVILMIFDKLI